MKQHVHSDLIAVLFAGVSAIVVINVTRAGAAYLSSKGGTLAQVGDTIGALVHWG